MAITYEEGSQATVKAPLPTSSTTPTPDPSTVMAAGWGMGGGTPGTGTAPATTTTPTQKWVVDNIGLGGVGGSGHWEPITPGSSTAPSTTTVANDGTSETQIENVDPDKTTAIKLTGEAVSYPPTMSPGETAATNWQNAPTAGATQPAAATGAKTATTATGAKVATGTGGTGTGGTGGTTAATAQPTSQWQKYFDQAQAMRFSYNPAEDNEYRLAASQVEQQVTDMMVGRGGLYSSVASSALTSRLMELQVSYQKQAYEKYLDEREYLMKTASFIADREDTAFQQNLALSKFQADMEQQRFDNSIKSAQLRISQANAAYNRQIAAAKTQQAAQQNQLLMMQGDYATTKQTYESMLAKWKKDKIADAEVSAFFGGNLQFIPFDSAIGQNYINQVSDILRQKENEIISYARQTNDGKTYLTALEMVHDEASDPETVKQNYSTAYTTEYNDLIALHQSGKSYSELLTYMVSNYSAYRDEMGTDNYNKLLTFLNSEAAKE